MTCQFNYYVVELPGGYGIQATTQARCATHGIDYQPKTTDGNLCPMGKLETRILALEEQLYAIDIRLTRAEAEE